MHNITTESNADLGENVETLDVLAALAGDFRFENHHQIVHYCLVFCFHWSDVVKKVLLFKFPNEFHEDSKVIGIILFLWTIRAKSVCLRGLLVHPDVEKNWYNIELHVSNVLMIAFHYRLCYIFCYS